MEIGNILLPILELEWYLAQYFWRQRSILPTFRSGKWFVKNIGGVDCILIFLCPLFRRILLITSLSTSERETYLIPFGYSGCMILHICGVDSATSWFGVVIDVG